MQAIRTNEKKVCFIFGTRPEIIKIAPIVKECEKNQIPFTLIHTGQHYSENMDSVFLADLNMPPVNYNLAVGSGSHATQTAHMLTAIEETLLREKPAVVVVQGDTNTVLAGALVAAKLHIPVAHVEAGLRSYDRTMPEEINRIMTGSVATLHFAPTEKSKENLLREGVDESTVYVTGNSIVDVMYENRSQAKRKSRIRRKLDLKKPYALVTLHRAENTDNKHRLQQILQALKAIAETHDLTLVWPMHPRAKKQIETFGLTHLLNAIPQAYIIEPVKFFDMIALQLGSKLIITDSGGVQEEACILQVPCVTLRTSTERPESMDVGANVLAGYDPETIQSAVAHMLSTTCDWVNPFGDGTAAKQIVAVLGNLIEGRIASVKRTSDVVIHAQIPQAIRRMNQSAD